MVGGQTNRPASAACATVGSSPRTASAHRRISISTSGRSTSASTTGSCPSGSFSSIAEALEATVIEIDAAVLLRRAGNRREARHLARPSRREARHHHVQRLNPHQRRRGDDRRIVAANDAVACAVRRQRYIVLQRLFEQHLAPIALDLDECRGQALGAGVEAEIDRRRNAERSAIEGSRRWRETDSGPQPDLTDADRMPPIEGGVHDKHDDDGHDCLADCSPMGRGSQQQPDNRPGASR